MYYATSNSRNFGGQNYSNNRFRPRGRQNFSRFNKRRGENIDPAKFISKASGQLQQEQVEIKNNFSDFALCNALQANLKYRKYVKPTPIQDQSIAHVLEGRDLLGLANTGTGKTAAFLLPLIDKVSKDKNQKVLIIAPTRELAQQIEDEFRLFSYGMHIFGVVCVGGAAMHRQITGLSRNPNFVIGTPGRLKDLAEQKYLKLSAFNNVVLDEVDRMLDMGFIYDIRIILGQLAQPRQSLFFSATLPAKTRDLVGEFSTNPVTVEIKSAQIAENVNQDVIRYRDNASKCEELHNLLIKPELKKVLIFIETKHEVERLAIELGRRGFKADSIHGNKRQSQRQRTLDAFKANQTNILVATDVAARGIDVKDITHVINYTVPQTYNDYIHRIGRTGRNNTPGCALTFVRA